MRQCLLVLLVGAAGALALPAAAFAEGGSFPGGFRLAQNWTPLTGPLGGRPRPGEAEPEKEPEPEKSKPDDAKSDKDEPQKSGDGSSSATPSGLHSLTVK